MINLGASASGGQNMGGTLRYTGSGETTNKVINLSNPQDFAIVDQTGSGLLKFTSAITSTAAGAAVRYLFLQGATSGAGEISGAIGNGSQAPVGVIKSGSGTWTLSGHNTYSYFTGINEGTLIAAADGALGSGNVSLTASGAILTLQLGVLNDYIGNGATLSLVTGSTLNLNFSGNGDVISNLVIDGLVQPAGIYNANTNPGLITGTGFIINNAVTVPEPSICLLFLLGIALIHLRRWLTPSLP